MKVRYIRLNAIITNYQANKLYKHFREHGIGSTERLPLYKYAVEKIQEYAPESIEHSVCIFMGPQEDRIMAKWNEMENDTVVSYDHV